MMHPLLPAGGFHAAEPHTVCLRIVGSNRVRLALTLASDRELQ